MLTCSYKSNQNLSVILGSGRGGEEEGANGIRYNCQKSIVYEFGNNKTKR
jgi:hypothetical protein